VCAEVGIVHPGDCDFDEREPLVACLLDLDQCGSRGPRWELGEGRFGERIEARSQVVLHA
jgi:hypothetical protein